jgi:hypothetical protein
MLDRPIRDLQLGSDPQFGMMQRRLQKREIL